MSVFEERLWQDLVRDHRDALAYDIVQLPRHRRRLPALTAAAAAIAATLAAVALWFGGGHSEPAYAVTQHTDGTVTITIRRLVGVQGADASLARLGVPVRTIAFEAGCAVKPSEFALARATPAQFQRLRQLIRTGHSAALKVNPEAIPAGDTLVLAALEVHKGAMGLSVKLYRGPAPPCLPLPMHQGPAS